MKKIEFFKVEGDRINRVRKYCPKCGPAIFLAEHKNRFSCGKCGYTEFKGGKKIEKPAPAEEKPVEEKVETKPEAPVEEPPKDESQESVGEEVPEEKEPTSETETPPEEKPEEDKKE
jgi:small subunit ribosomal protein S27Ae